MYYVDRKIEVRYAETDMMGVVYHSNYLIWMEIGRTAFLNGIGYPYEILMNDGILTPVSSININYKMPVKYGDDVFIRTWVKKSTPIRTTYRSVVFNSNGDICIDAECQVTCVEQNAGADFKLINFKKKYPDWFNDYQNIAVGNDESEIFKTTKFTNEQKYQR